MKKTHEKNLARITEFLTVISREFSVLPNKVWKEVESEKYKSLKKWKKFEDEAYARRLFKVEDRNTLVFVLTEKGKELIKKYYKKKGL